MVDKHIYSIKISRIETEHLKPRRLGYIPLIDTLDSYSEHLDFILAEGQSTFFNLENDSIL